MKTTGLTKKGVPIVKDMIDLNNRIEELLSTVRSVKGDIQDSLDIPTSTANESGASTPTTSVYSFNKTIADQPRTVGGGLSYSTGATVRILDRVNLDQQRDFEFIFNHAYFYIDFILNYEKDNLNENPVALIVFGTRSETGKYGNTDIAIIKPLIKFRINPVNQTISSLDNHPDKTWSFEEINDFLWRTLSELWKEVILINNKSFLP